MILNLNTFTPDDNAQPNESYVKYGWQRGTIEATLNGVTKRVTATKYKENEITSCGFVVKYRTGTKVWSATVSTRQYHDGKIGEIIMGGFDSRSGRHQLLNGLSFKDEVNPQYLSKR